MKVGRFYGGIGAVIRARSDGRYLLLRRSEEKDFAAGVWECVTGRVDQGEGFEDALRREVSEETSLEVQVECLMGTTHFYRGLARPEDELIGVIYLCSLDQPRPIRLSAEHSEYRWVSAAEAEAFFHSSHPSIQWLRRVMARAEAVWRLLPAELLEYFRKEGSELG